MLATQNVDQQLGDVNSPRVSRPPLQQDCFKKRKYFCPHCSVGQGYEFLVMC